MANGLSSALLKVYDSVRDMEKTTYRSQGLLNDLERIRKHTMFAMAQSYKKKLSFEEQAILTNALYDTQSLLQRMLTHNYTFTHQGYDTEERVPESLVRQALDALSNAIVLSNKTRMVAGNYILQCKHCGESANYKEEACHANTFCDAKCQAKFYSSQ